MFAKPKYVATTPKNITSSMAKKTADYFHVTATGDVPSIQAEGLRGSTTPRHRGETLAKVSIFALISDQEELADHIARSQLWPLQHIGSYSLLRISAKGVTGPVHPDYVAERSAGWQRIIEQDLIDPKYVTVERVRQLDYPGDRVHEISQSICRRVWTAEEWALMRRWFSPEILQYHEAWEAKPKTKPKEKAKGKKKK